MFTVRTLDDNCTIHKQWEHYTTPYTALYDALLTVIITDRNS